MAMFYKIEDIHACVFYRLLLFIAFETIYIAPSSLITIKNFLQRIPFNEIKQNSILLFEINLTSKLMNTFNEEKCRLLEQSYMAVT